MAPAHRPAARPCAATLLALLLAGCANAPTAEPLSMPVATVADFGVDGDPFHGDPGAAVAVVAWDAPGCSVCAGFHFNAFPGLKASYVDDGRVVWYVQQWTVGSDYDRPASIALECLHRQGAADAYWPFWDFVFQQQNRIGADRLRQELQDVAQANGLDETTLLRCFDAEESAPEVAADIEAGVDAGATTSPAFVVLGPEGARGPTGPSGLEAAIEAALAST